MVAPAILLADITTGHPEVTRALYQIESILRRRRPDLVIHLLELNKFNDVPKLVEKLLAKEVSEAVIVPLDLRSATDYAPPFDEASKLIRAQNISCVVARPIGPASELLNILDERLRDSLLQSSALELDGLVLVARAGGDARGTALIARRARQWSSHHKLPVQLAIESGDGSATAAAVNTLRIQGRRHIAVAGLFLTPGPAYIKHAKAASKAGAIAVARPIGDSPHFSQLVLARYAFGAMELLDGHPQPTAVDADYRFLSSRTRLSLQP